MRLERKHKNIIIVGIAAFFILYGFLDMKFNFNISAEVEDKVTWVLTIIAVALLFSGTKPKFKNMDVADNSKLENTEDNQSNTINTANSIAADSEVNGVENSDKVIGDTTEQENSSDAEIKDK